MSEMDLFLNSKRPVDIPLKFIHRYLDDIFNLKLALQSLLCKEKYLHYIIPRCIKLF